MSIRGLLGMAAVPIVALASGCTTTGPSLGSMSGYAPPCEGAYISQQGVRAVKVRVALTQHERVVKVQTVTGSHTYHFTVLPGIYVVRSDQGGTTPEPLKVTAGQNTSVNLYSICK